MNQLKNLHPLIWNVLIGTMFGRMATSMSIPFLAIYLTQVKGVPPSQTGMVIAVSALIGVGSSFFGGYLSDRFGRKIILLVSIFLWSTVFFGFGIVESVLGFFIMNGLNGFCRSVFEPTSRALLSDLTESKNRLIIFNLRYTAINIGVIFGPILGYYFGSSENTSAFFIAGLVYILYGISLIITFHKTNIINQSYHQTEAKQRITLKGAFEVTVNDSVLLMTIIGLILAISGYSHFSSTLPQFLSNATYITNGDRMFSILLALNAIIVISLQYPLLKIGKKYSPLMSILIGNIISSLSLIGFGFAVGFPVWIAIIILFTIGEVLMFSMTDMFLDTIAKPELRGTYFGAMGFTVIGNVIGPAIGGLFLDYFGYDQPLLVFGSLCAISLFGIPFLLIVHLKLNRQKTQIQEAR